MFASCSKETNEKSTADVNFDLRTAELSLDNVFDEMETFWITSFTEYGMDVVCGCDCEDIEQLPNIYNSSVHLLPELTNNSTIGITECDDLLTVFKSGCGFESLEDYKEFVVEQVYESETIVGEEQNFIVSLINDMYNNEYDSESYQQQWEELPYNEITNNNLSLMVVLGMESVMSFHENNSDLFIPIGPIGPTTVPVVDGGDDDINALWHGLAGVASGVFAVAASAVEDIYFDTGYGVGDPVGAMTSSFVKGFIGGAVISL